MEALFIALALFSGWKIPGLGGILWRKEGGS
jgi:hypothetical protein